MARSMEKMELLGAEDVAGLVGVKETTVYRWCKQGRLPCLKVGKYWRIRRGDLEDFLEGSRHHATLAGRLDSFLRVPDSVLAITQNMDILHRIDAAFFRVGASRGRSEEHTSELQSRQYLVCRLLLEKKKPIPRTCHVLLSMPSALLYSKLCVGSQTDPD